MSEEIKNSNVTLQMQLRKATIQDDSAIHSLINSQVLTGNLLPRSLNEIHRTIQDFIVVEHNNTVIACGSLQIFTAILGEIRSLVVDDAYKGVGAGKMIVNELINQARILKLKQLMVLTYKPAFFQRFGFEIVKKHYFPEKVWGVCIKCYKFNHCDEIALLLVL